MKKSTSKPTALITGAGTGLGASLAKHLAGRGFAIAVHYHSSDKKAEKVVAAIRKQRRNAQAFQADLATGASADRLLQEVTAWSGGRLDVLVNNAGVYVGGPVAELTDKDWFDGFNSTASAAFFTTRAALPFLRKSKLPGGARIINMGDSSCDRPTARGQALGYHIGKTGVLILTRSLARAEAKHGLTCNMISPGYLENSEDLLPTGSIPAGRYGTFDDVRNAVDFLLRPESNYVNGSNLVLSGGWNLR